MRLIELDKGSKGQQVQLLQHLLNTIGQNRPPLELDGKFGPATDKAVRRYQERRHLSVDGIVGQDTWRSLGMKSSALPRGAIASATPQRSVPVPSVRRLVTGGPARMQPAVAAAPIARSQLAVDQAASPVARAAPVMEPPGTAINAPWMRVALAEKWVHEVAGPGNNPRIMEYHATTSLGRQPDSVAWCSSFVNWCLKQVGIRGTNSAAAASWANWGDPLDEPKYGCIVQIHHGAAGHDRSTGSSSGNHVAFFVRRTATHITLLGGNQSDQVKESDFRISGYQVRALRWPSGR